MKIKKYQLTYIATIAFLAGFCATLLTGCREENGLGKIDILSPVIDAVEMSKLDSTQLALVESESDVSIEKIIDLVKLESECDKKNVECKQTMPLLYSGTEYKTHIYINPAGDTGYYILLTKDINDIKYEKSIGFGEDSQSFSYDWRKKYAEID